MNEYEIAKAAEAKLAKIARTRRPTAQETADAERAYKAAARLSDAAPALRDALERLEAECASRKDEHFRPVGDGHPARVAARAALAKARGE